MDAVADQEEANPRRLRTVLFAYACIPGRGSEPGLGWNTAREIADHHEVWVVTQAQHRPAIEAELSRSRAPNLHFAYYDPPAWINRWKKSTRLTGDLHYYVWQLGAYAVAKRLHREVNFDLSHHVTYTTYWKPSYLSLLPVPFVWGSVGGAESAPKAFWKDFGFYGKAYEAARDLARWVGEHDPFVKMTARRSALALANTEETADRLGALGAANVRVLNDAGLHSEEIEVLGRYATHQEGPVRFLSTARLLHWKGVELGLRAFAQAGLRNAEYWIVGDGPELNRLQALAKELEVTDRVMFWGRLPRDEVLRRLGESHILVHPSLHDSGGWSCTEAMAAGRPVICLDLGGPAMHVTGETGFKIPAIGPEQAVRDMAEAMRVLAQDRERRISMSEAGRRRVAECFDWSKKGALLARFYEEVCR